MSSVYPDITEAVQIFKKQAQDISEEIKKLKEAIAYNTKLLESILSMIENKRNVHTDASKMVNNLSSIIGNNPAIKSNPDLANLINQMFDQLGSMKGEKP